MTNFNRYINKPIYAIVFSLILVSIRGLRFGGDIVPSYFFCILFFLKIIFIYVILRLYIKLQASTILYLFFIYSEIVLETIVLDFFL